MTHLHRDQTGGLHRFPHAEILAVKPEEQPLYSHTTASGGEVSCPTSVVKGVSSTTSLITRGALEKSFSKGAWWTKAAL